MKSSTRNLLSLVTAAALAVSILTPDARGQSSEMRVGQFVSADTIALVSAGKTITLRKGEHAGPWTLLELLPADSKSSRLAVLEDFSRFDGHLLFVDAAGIQLDLPKTLEPTFPDPAKLYGGHTLDQLLNSPHDLLAEEMLAGPNDPDPAKIFQCFPPIRKMKTITFVGTHDNIDKVGFDYEGRSPNFDPAVYSPDIVKIRDQGKVWNGLVGGWLPVIRYVYPVDTNHWTEMLAFAPLRGSDGNQRIQPVWYRVTRIQNGSVQWTGCFDTYHPFPPRTQYAPKAFYAELLALHQGWSRLLKPAMQIKLPDQRLQDMAVHSLVRDMITRAGDFPKYGVFDKNYAGSEHEGFPDTFTADTATSLEWGMVDLAGRYIDNYFGQYVRDDGSILYRGPETGQFGRMLTILAQYANYGGDPQVLLRRRTRIDGLTKVLLSMRAKAQLLPKDDPAYGMLAGWSEADACLDPEPSRYMRPYFSNSAEAARGFRDLGHVWQKLGRQHHDSELTAWGDRLVRESESLRTDLRTALQRSVLKVNGETILPCIAGVQEPFHVVVARDSLDPQYRAYRAFMEMLYSGMLDKAQVSSIVRYRASHYDTILGIPIAYGYRTSELAGFLSYGHGYGLIQHDMPREAILMLYSIMAHQYTRGTWTAPETRSILPDRPMAPYCSPAQVVVPLLTRWLLVFEDPQSETLWLGKGLPRDWLENGKTTAVSGAPTRWGKVGFTVASHLQNNSIAVKLALPPTPFAATTVIRLRAPLGRTMKSVTVNSKPWKQFNPKDETITIPPGYSKVVDVAASY